MSDQNGGGLISWSINSIGDIITRYRIHKHNKQARGIEECRSVTPDTLFPAQSCQENIIISGGDSWGRLQLSECLIKNSLNQGRSMIVLHIANSGLESIVNNLGVVVNRNNKLFDGFTSFSLQEICQIVLDTCKAKYDIKPNGRYVLQVVYELLSNKKIRPYFSNYARCPYHQLAEKINERLANGLITQDAADKLHSLLMMGQAECAKIDSFFYDMNAQMSHIATDNANKTGGSSVLSAIKKGQILCIDLNSSANAMLVELIVNSLIIAMSRGYGFSLFLDDVAIANNESLKNMLCQTSSHNNIICSKDLYALFGGKDDVFRTVAGLAEKTILLSHGSHISCEQWSKYIGEYDKINVTHTKSVNEPHDNNETSINRGQTMSDKREYKIKPEQINRLSQGEIFIYDNQTGSLIHTNVV
jgi:hypothetical protein